MTPAPTQPAKPLKVAWFSYFPVEWLTEMPEHVQQLPRMHPATWQQVLFAELEDRPDFELHILVLRRSFPRSCTFQRGRATFHLLKTPAGLRTPSLFWIDTWLIRRKLAQVKPDVLHAWGTEGGAVAVAARLPYPYVVSMQGIMTWIRTQAPLSRYHRLMALFEDRYVPRAPAVTAESVFAVRYLQERYSGLNVQQVEHAPHWRFHRLQRTPQTTPLRFLFVGYRCFLKGFDLAVMALDQLRNEMPFELVLVGDEDSRWIQGLRGKVSADLWSRFQSKGHLPTEQVAHEMAQATMMIYPTRADTSPNVVKEAVAAGLPVLASSVGGIVDYVIPERNGLLFPSGSVAGLTSIIRAAAHHPLFRQGIVDPATLAQTRAYLSPQLMAAKFHAIYRQLAGLGEPTGS